MAHPGLPRNVRLPFSFSSLPLLLVLITTVPLAIAQRASCVSTPGVNLQLYSACEVLASQLAQSSLPTDGSAVALSTLVSLTPTTIGTAKNGLPTAVILTSLPMPTSVVATGSDVSSSSSSGASDTSASSTSSAMSGSSSSSVLGAAAMSSAASSEAFSASASSSASSVAAAQSASASLTNDASTNSNHDYRDHVVIPVAVVCTVVPVLLIALLLVFFCLRRRRRRQGASGHLVDEKTSTGINGSSLPGDDAAATGGAHAANTGHAYDPKQPYGGHVDHNGFGAGAATGLAAGTGAAIGASAVGRHADHRAHGAVDHSNPTHPTVSGGNHAAGKDAEAAGAVGTGAMAAAASKNKSASRSRSRSNSAPRFSAFGGFLHNRSTTDSRGGQSGTSSVNEKPPTLPNMEPQMGHGTWYEGVDPGREFDTTDKARPASSFYESSVEPTGNLVASSGALGALKASQTGTPRSDSDTMGSMPFRAPQPPRTSDPFRTPPARVSDPSELAGAGGSASTRTHLRGSEQHSGEDPSGHTSMSSADNAAREGSPDDSLFGPYRPPTPYSDLLMFSDARRKQGNAAYTSPDTVGEVVAGRWSGYTPSEGQTQYVTPTAHKPTTPPVELAADASRPDMPARSPRRAHEQVLHYPTAAEARTFDFGSPSSPTRAAGEETFTDAQESLAPARAPRPSSILRKPVGGR